MVQIINSYIKILKMGVKLQFNVQIHRVYRTHKYKKYYFIISE